MDEELYITGPVIVNGIPDSDGDTLNSVEIRTIFTKYINHLSDIQHDRIDYEGVDVLANWISEEDTTINGKNVPAKSWMATVKVTDPETLTAINKGELTCFSLGSVSATGKTRKAWFIDKRISYHDLKTMDEVIPLRISLVDEGANGFPFEIETREVYINKNRENNISGENNMVEKDNMIKENNIKNDTEAKFSFKEWLGIEKHFKNNNIDKTGNAESTSEKSENDAEQNIQALFDKIDALAEEIAEIKEVISVGVDKKEEKKESDDSETDNQKEEKKESDDSETDNQKEETDINKGITDKPADKPDITESQSNFYKNTGRDAFGRKIRR